METKAALVRADRAVELNAVTAVHLSLAVVIDPCYAEAVASLRLQQTLQNTEFPILFLMLVNYKSDGIEHFLNGLMKLGLSGIILNNLFHDFFYVCHIGHSLIL